MAKSKKHIPEKPVLFSSPRYEYLAEEVAKIGNLRFERPTRKDFGNGSRYLRIDLTAVSARDVVIIGGTIDAAETDEIERLAHTVHRYGARSLTFVNPFMGTQRQERASKPGEQVSAKLEAIRFSRLPHCPWGNRMLLFDLHNECIASFFEGDFVSVPVQCKDVIVPAIKEAGGKNFVLMAADGGILKWTQSLADELGIVAGGCRKRRFEDRVEIVDIFGEVEGKNVILHDDLLDTGGTAEMAAKKFLELGAKTVTLIVTHAILPGDSLQRIKKNGYLSKIIATNTHPRAVDLTAGESPRGALLRIKSVAGLIESRIRNPWVW